MNISLITVSQQTKLEVDFFFKRSRADSNQRVEVKATVFPDRHGIAKLECGADSNFILTFNVQEYNENGVTIKTDIADGAISIAKPVIIIPYYEKGIIEIGKNHSNFERSEFSLSIIASQEQSETLNS